MTSFTSNILKCNVKCKSIRRTYALCLIQGRRTTLSVLITFCNHIHRVNSILRQSEVWFCHIWFLTWSKLVQFPSIGPSKPLYLEGWHVWIKNVAILYLFLLMCVILKPKVTLGHERAAGWRHQPAPTHSRSCDKELLLAGWSCWQKRGTFVCKMSDSLMICVRPFSISIFVARRSGS